MFSVVCVSSAATFDVQNTTAENGSQINMTGQFISNSRAIGCFVVLQCDYGSPDEFRVLIRADISNPIVATMVDAPPSTYKMYVFDVEMSGDINTNPAFIYPNEVDVTQGKLF